MTDQRADRLETILEGGVIAILRGVPTDAVVAVADALVAGGITAVEITADAPGAGRALTRVAEAMDDRPVAVGAGTVLDGATARMMLSRGAEFIVSPTFDRDVVETANVEAVPAIPGVMTPTEAIRAYAAGADAIKLFPADTVGAGHISALHGPLPQLTIIPTGGIDRENAEAFLGAGAAGLGIGSALVDGNLVEAERWEELTQRAVAFTDLVERHRG